MILDTVQRQLDLCLEREAQQLFNQTAGYSVSVFFRRQKDTNSPANHLTIFYHEYAGVSIGDELQLNDDPNTILLVLNCENIESTDYRRSDLVKCNCFADFCYVTSGYDEKHNRVEIAEAYDSSVPCFASSGMNSAVQTRTADDLQILCSGRHGMTVGNIITIKKMAENKDHTYKPGIAYFEASAVDNSNLIISPVDNTGGGLITILARTTSQTFG